MPAPHEPWVLQAWIRRVFGGAVAKRSPSCIVRERLGGEPVVGDAGSQSDGRSLGERCVGTFSFDIFVLRSWDAGGGFEFGLLPLPLGS